MMNMLNYIKNVVTRYLIMHQTSLGVFIILFLTKAKKRNYHLLFCSRVTHWSTEH